MFSVVILYSPDRLSQLQITLSCLREMSYIGEIIVSVDGKANFNSSLVDIVIETQRDNYYCWANCINAGIDACTNENILYVDSDRILPKSYLEISVDLLNDNSFVFPKHLYQLTTDVDINIVRDIRETPSKYFHLMKYDPRVYSHPLDSIRQKNPMSGCVCFTKSGYNRSKGFDASFVGWGYPDTDFYMSTYKQGYCFHAVDCVELHLNHTYDDYIDYVLNRSKVRLMGLWNGVKFADKWGVPVGRPIIDSAAELRIPINVVRSYSLAGFLDRYKPVKLL